MKRKFLILIFIFIISSPFLFSEGKPKKFPYMEDTPQGKKLILPEGLDTYLSVEFPNYRIPDENELSPDMLAYYHSRLIGIHPDIIWGDFNGNKKIDYALLIITSQSKWGPIVELVILNGENGRDKFTPYRLAEIYNFKEDYLSFDDNKLIKGRYKKGAWFINWDKKNRTYIINKS